MDGRVVTDIEHRIVVWGLHLRDVEEVEDFPLCTSDEYNWLSILEGYVLTDVKAISLQYQD